MVTMGLAGLGLIGEQLFPAAVFSLFERKLLHPEEAASQATLRNSQYDVILFGTSRYGSAIAENLRQAGCRLLLVDFNPDSVKRWREAGWSAIYGDAGDRGFLEMLPLDGVRWVVSTLPQHDLGVAHDDPRLVLLSGLKRQGFRGDIAISTQHIVERDELRATGATLVFTPFQDAAHQAVKLMQEQQAR